MENISTPRSRKLTGLSAVFGVAAFALTVHFGNVLDGTHLEKGHVWSSLSARDKVELAAIGGAEIGVVAAVVAAARARRRPGG